MLPDRILDHLSRVAELPDFSGTRYEVQEEIGRGGMGVVYRAWDAQLERKVAVKVMEGDAVITGEARLLAQLEHPGLVPVYDAGTLPDGRLWYAMRLVDGKRLDEFLSVETALPPRLRVLEKVCEAVAFAHNRGVIHCDLKPQNIMVGGFGEVWVMDWGVARTLGAAAPAAGTQHYMAPEQAHSPDKRADVFALGRLLQEMLPVPVRRPLAAIARKATEVDPASRYQCVQDFAADLTNYLDGLPVTAYRERVWERVARFWRRNEVLMLLLSTYVAVKVVLYLVRR